MKDKKVFYKGQTLFMQQDINKIRENMCPNCDGEIARFLKSSWWTCENCGMFKIKLIKEKSND